MSLMVTRTRRVAATVSRKLKAVEVMAETGAYFKVAEALGIDIRTLTAWRRKDPEFQRRLDHARVVEYEAVYVDDLIGTMMDRVRHGDLVEELDATGRVVKTVRKRTSQQVLDVLQRVDPRFHPKAELNHQHQHTHQLVGILKRRQPRDITPQTPQTEDGRGEGARSGVSSTLPAPESGADQSHLPALLPEPAGAVGGGGAGRDGPPPGGGAHAGAPVSPEATSPHREETLDEDAHRIEFLAGGDESVAAETVSGADDGISAPDRGDDDGVSHAGG